MPSTLLLIALVALPFVGSVLAALLPAHARNAAAWLAGAITLADLGMVLATYSPIADGGVVRAVFAWAPALGLDFVLRLDGLAWVFAALIAGIGAFTIIYAHYYMAPSDPVPRLFAFLLAFMGAMLGLVVSGNLIELVFFWELTSLFSFVLIGYWQEDAAAREGARTALIVTGGGGLSLFAGVLILGHVVGSFTLDAVLASGDALRVSPLYRLALALILLGAFTKSAQFPFQFWLSGAMAAPTPVSAYLHSATLVNAGVFLLMRLWPVLAGTAIWFWIVSGIGLATLLLGAYLAVFQHDLKGLLAYSTISNLGLITLLLGLDSRLALVAAIFHTINHAAFKASLFMAAGAVDRGSGTRDLRRLSGLWRFMPISATLATVAAAAMAGVPLLNGFLSKEMFFAETVTGHVESILDDALPYAATLAGIFTVTYSIRLIHDVFFGAAPADLPRTPAPPPRWMRFPEEVLVLICLVVGLIPEVTVGPFLATAVRAVLGGESPAYDLAIWHGFTLPLLMSAIALSGGAVFYLALRRIGFARLPRAPLLGRIAGGRIFAHLLVALTNGVSRPLVGHLSTKRLQPQLRLLIATAAIAAAWPLWGSSLGVWRTPHAACDPAFALLWVVGIACAIGTARVARHRRFVSLVLLSGTGLTLVLTFAWLSAPDLALTQFLVETVTSVLLLLGLRWLPKRGETAEERGRAASRARGRGDLALAGLAGGGLAFLAYAMMRPRPVSDLARYFVAHAASQGGGNNVVNVILVDFRGLDTLGEITVLATVAIAVYALLRRFRPPSGSAPGGPETGEGPHAGLSPVPMLLARLLFAPIGLIALFLLLRGHDLPGGGFAAGLMMATAFLVQYMAGGTRWLEARVRLHPLRWMSAGLGLALGAGAGAWGLGRPFLTAYSVPLIGRMTLPSVLIFDAGVFALVLGATVLMLIGLAHLSVRSHRTDLGKPGEP